MPILNFATGASSIFNETQETTYASTSSTYVDRVNTLEGIGVSRDINSNRYAKLDFEPQSHVWASGVFYISPKLGDGYDHWYNGGYIFTFWAGDEVAGYLMSTTSENCRLYLKDGGTSVDLGVYVPPVKVKARLDMEFKVDPVNGIFRLYSEGALVLEYLGDTKRSNTWDTIDGVSYGAIAGDQSWIGTTYWSRMFVANESSLPIEMVQHQITGAGRFSEMTGDYTSVNTLGNPNDVTKITTSESEKKQSFSISELPVQYQTGYRKVSMGIYARAASGGNTVGSLSMMLDDGVNVSESSPVTTSEFLSPTKAIFETAPDGGDLGISGLEVGIVTKPVV